VTWDLDSYFPQFDGSQMRQFKSDLDREIGELKKRSENMTDLTTENSNSWVSILIKMEKLYSRLGHLSSYLSCLEAAHAEDERYAREQANLAQLYAAYEKIKIELQHAVKNITADAFNSICEHPDLNEISYYIIRLKEQATYTMSRREEALASDLNIDGLSAWGRLYDKISGKLEFEYVNKAGVKERRPISQWRSLISNPDREIGRAAFEGGNRAWQGIEETCAAALNAIAGSRLTLYRHRKVKHFIDQALFDAAISSKTLKAMHQAVTKNIELARDILRHKARFLGRKGIWFFEREAPLPLATPGSFEWMKAVKMVHGAFLSSYPALSEYFKHMITNHWVESEARPNKRPGAFCTNSSFIGEQRVFMTYYGSLGDITTLAHEVGHAWHAHLMKDLRPFARRYPMTMAETASIFAEQLLIESLHNNPEVENQQKLALLDTELTDAAIFLLDITTRFNFEKKFYEEREDGEVSVSRLKAIMTETQRNTYGDALLAGGEDPYFWASKLHFFITGTSFYNFPYTFGYLLARAICDRFRIEGDQLIPDYESFLRISGSGTVEDVCQRALKIDITSPTFWEGAIQSLKTPLERYRKNLSKD
jgi:oligoendopeptidase F